MGERGAAMGTAEAVSLGEYLRTSWSPDREWVAGEVRERNMGDGIHSVVQAFLILFFGMREERWKVEARPELRVQVSATNFRIPDVLLVRAGTPFELVVETPPLLCVEVLSPDDRMGDMLGKVEDYLRMGVGTVWVIDPRRREGMMTDGGDLRRVEVLTVPGTEIRVSMAEVLRDLDRRMGSTA